MSAITAQTVNELRQRTGAGLMDCKKALTEANADMEKAVEILRIKGVATRNKKADRKASEGILAVQVSADGRNAILLELNCETDFVAKNEAFVALAKDLVGQAAAKGVENLLDQPYHADASRKVNDYLNDQVTKIGENLKVSRVLKFEANGVGRVSAYVHTGAKIAVLLELGLKSQTAAAHADVADLARQLAMQVVANNARFVRRDDVSAEVVAKEKEIALEFTKSEADKAIDEAKRVVEDYRGQLLEQKAANDVEAIAELEKRIVVSEKQVIASESRKKGQLSNIEKIVAGRVDKFFADACLLEQPFFRDPDKKVSDLLTEAKAKVGEEVSIVRFVRFQVGETAAE
ncbi:elongation factor Ts [Verrucomicrobiota bacterium]|nr:elongation factor Ts [Verrucomicrobiota bacterium]GDY17676.1 elongation factor Ts [Verrucomicrobiota bacterium]